MQRVGNITATAKELASKYDLVLIDAGGRDSDELRAGLVAADLLLTPFKPSQADLDTVYQLSDVIKQAQKGFNPALKTLAVLTMSPTHPANTEIKGARDYLKKHLKVASCLLHCLLYTSPSPRDRG